jgi:hypothetical protein
MVDGTSVAILFGETLMPAGRPRLAIRLPKSWTSQVRSAVLHVISLARFSLAYSRSWAADSANTRLRLKAALERAEEEIALLREELRIKDARMTQIPPHRRPYYPPVERMAALQLRAARNWSLQQTAEAFLLTAATISSWMKRIDEPGTHPLVQLREPVNKWPEFVRYLVQQLRVLCPSLGKVKIAQILARAGLHLGVSTVGLILKEKPIPSPTVAEPHLPKKQVVTSKHPNHLWQTDLTVVPIGPGSWTSWLPFSLPQCWPFSWWLAVVIDHYSRRIMGVTLFRQAPTSKAMRLFLARVIHAADANPKPWLQIGDPSLTAKASGRGVRKRGSSRVSAPWGGMAASR